MRSNPIAVTASKLTIHHETNRVFLGVLRGWTAGSVQGPPLYFNSEVENCDCMWWRRRRTPSLAVTKQSLAAAAALTVAGRWVIGDKGSIHDGHVSTAPQKAVITFPFNDLHG